MKRILIVDQYCPRPYTTETLVTSPMGGTESTVARVTSKLNEMGQMVCVGQHNRTEDEGAFIPLDTAWTRHKWDRIILLRSTAMIEHAAQHAKKVYVWLHDLPHRDLLTYRDAIVKHKPHFVCVSGWHKTQTEELLRTQIDSWDMPRMSFAYGAIDDDLGPNGTKYDKNKLIFFSSPHKGLRQTLDHFANLVSFNPDFRLHISNPGYISDIIIEGDLSSKIVNMGSLKKEDMMQQVRESLCVFYPNYVFPETFGLVFAESNAVGTPVISHPIGSAAEVLYHPYELVDCRNPKALIDRVMAWHRGDRPVVKANPEYRLTNVAKKWERILEAQK